MVFTVNGTGYQYGPNGVTDQDTLTEYKKADPLADAQSQTSQYIWAFTPPNIACHAGVAMITEMKIQWTKRLLTGLLFVLFILIVCLYVQKSDGQGPRNRHLVDQFRSVLRQAAKKSRYWGYPLHGWPNPYAKVLILLRRDGSRLPRIWRARALARYATYIGGLGQHYVGKARALIPHPGAWYVAKKKLLLRRAVSVCPSYADGWIALALVLQDQHHYAGYIKNSHHAFFDLYLKRALRAGPLNAYANSLRALEIINNYGGHWRHPPSHIFHGDFGFSSPQWARAFCYRALVYLKYRRPHTKRGFLASLDGLDVGFFRVALKYYEPKQLAELDADIWKPGPGPSPDPWPPPEKKAARAPPTTRPAH